MLLGVVTTNVVVNEPVNPPVLCSDLTKELVGRNELLFQSGQCDVRVGYIGCDHCDVPGIRIYARAETLMLSSVVGVAVRNMIFNNGYAGVHTGRPPDGGPHLQEQCEN